jgi:hypothetical protein
MVSDGVIRPPGRGRSSIFFFLRIELCIGGYVPSYRVQGCIGCIVDIIN